jgi:hypothetical protein
MNTRLVPMDPRKMTIMTSKKVKIGKWYTPDASSNIDWSERRLFSSLSLDQAFWKFPLYYIIFSLKTVHMYASCFEVAEY